jgi:hypothetical protein
MKIGVITLLVAAMGLTFTGVARSQPDAEGSVRAQSSTEVGADRGGAAVSQASEASAQTAPGTLTFEEGTELNAELTRRVDARRARPGDEVRAEVTEDVESNGEVVLERGTRLIGRVTDARPHGGAGAAAESRLAIVFEKAIVGRDREVPIHATIHALAAAEGEMQAAGGRAVSGAGPEARQSARGFGSVSGGAIAGGGPASGGVIGGAGSVVGSAGGVVSGNAGAVGTVGDRVGTTAGGVRGAAGATTAVYQSSNAVGGPDAAGRLGAGSRGVFGIDGLEIVSRGAAGAGAATRTGAGQGNTVAGAAGAAGAGSRADAAGATIIASASGNVRLDSGTRMLLVASGSASGSASVSR